MNATPTNLKKPPAEVLIPVFVKIGPGGSAVGMASIGYHKCDKSNPGSISKKAAFFDHIDRPDIVFSNLQTAHRKQDIPMGRALMQAWDECFSWAKPDGVNLPIRSDDEREKLAASIAWGQQLMQQQPA